MGRKSLRRPRFQNLEINHPSFFASTKISEFEWTMLRLQGALDNDIHIAVKQFLANGVPLDLNSIYAAIQKSNSSLKRKPKKVLQASIERVLNFMGAGNDDSADSELEAENRVLQAAPDADIMNKSLRATLSSAPETAPPSPSMNGDDASRKRRMANGEPIPKRQKADKASTSAPSDVSLDDIGGMDDVIEQLGEHLTLPLLRPEVYREMHIQLPRGVLLHGPPGCGKTMLTRAFAAELGLPFVEILGPSIVSGMSGESEKVRQGSLAWRRVCCM